MGRSICSLFPRVVENTFGLTQDEGSRLLFYRAGED